MISERAPRNQVGKDPGWELSYCGIQQTCDDCLSGLMRERETLDEAKRNEMAGDFSPVEDWPNGQPELWPVLVTGQFH
jgi:hypothetical protein